MREHSQPEKERPQERRSPAALPAGSVPLVAAFAGGEIRNKRERLGAGAAFTRRGRFNNPPVTLRGGGGGVLGTGR
ncbi:MAG: hypothetical protein LBK73_11915, partial [Treponema sp.]|nr:hypothetical protein [Treponema sp.]